MSFTETLQSITGKLLADCTDQELYLALYQRRIPYWQAAVQQPHQSGAVR